MCLQSLAIFQIHRPVAEAVQFVFDYEYQGPFQVDPIIVKLIRFGTPHFRRGAIETRPFAVVG